VSNYRQNVLLLKKEKDVVLDIQGEFDVILADPPWQYRKGTVQPKRKIEFQYSTISFKQLQLLKIPAKKNAILFLWATNPLLPKALELMKSWGFNYKTNFVWVKDKIGLGWYVRGKHELLLIGKKGVKFPVPEPSRRPPSVIEYPRRKHSEKPPVQEIIEKMYPNKSYLELFARKKREGWTVWGDEV